MNTEKQIEFDKIKEKWKSLAVTDKAREKIDGAACCLSESELRKQMRDTTNSRKLMEALGTPPFQTVEEVKGILSSELSQLPGGIIIYLTAFYLSADLLSHFLKLL